MSITVAPTIRPSLRCLSSATNKTGAAGNVDEGKRNPRRTLNPSKASSTSRKVVTQLAKKNTQAVNRPIRFDRFKKQLQEVGVENLQKVEFSEDEFVLIRLGNGYGCEDQKEFDERLNNAFDDEEHAMVLLDYNPDMSAEEQWKICERFGCEAEDLALIFFNATREQAERLGKLNLRR